MTSDFISLVTSCVGLQEEEEEPQIAYPVSFTWASHIAASACSWDVKLYLPNQCDGLREEEPQTTSPMSHIATNVLTGC